MRFVTSTIGLAVFAFLLAPALRADNKTTPTPDATDETVSRVAPGPAPHEATLADPAPTPLPDPPRSKHEGGNVPRIELFTGYTYLRNIPADSSDRLAWLHGGSASLAVNLNRYLGLVADFGGFPADRFSPSPTGGVEDASGTVFTYMFGPRVSFRHHRVTPFVQTLFGVAHAGPLTLSNCNVNCTPLAAEDAFSMTAGGGLDIKVHRHIAIRLFQAEYMMTRFADASSHSGQELRQNDVRLLTGLVFSFGSMGEPPTPASASCSAEPVEVFAGEPVTGTATGSNFNPKRPMHYDWNGTGVKVTGSNASTQIDTTGLQPGQYQVSANLSDGSKRGAASCAARFTVKQPHPPEIACSSNPGSVAVGGTSTIRANANSPDNRRVSYSYSASSGNVSGTDATATLNTAGAGPGPITVTCMASDDRNPALTASAITTVTVETPPPPPPPAPSPEIKELEARLTLHSIYFQTARPTVKNPDAGLVASQEAVVTSLASDFNRYLTFKPDAHLILGGHADSRGSAAYNKALTERRVNRTKSILVEHGVPADRIDVQSFGDQEQLNAEQVKQQMQENPDLSADDRRQMLRNLQVIVLANNRRVDVSLSTTGQESVRRYPFNAKDALALISTKGVAKEPVAKKTAKKPAKKQ